jgi:hypothetical protein
MGASCVLAALPLVWRAFSVHGQSYWLSILNAPAALAYLMAEALDGKISKLDV